MARALRLGLLLDLSPRKLGSMEDWLVGLVREATQRGHTVDIFCRDPMHPAFVEAITRRGGTLNAIDALIDKRLGAVRRLSRYDVLQFNFFQVREVIPTLCYAAATAKVVYVDHTSGRPGTTRGMRHRILDAVTARRLSRVVGVSAYVSERDRRRFALPGERVVTIHNGVDVERFRTDRGTGGRAQEPVGTHRPFELLAVANLIPWKGLDVLLRALGTLKEEVPFRLRIAGDGAERPALERLAEALNIRDRVAFLGLRDDVPELLKRSDAFVHPAIWDEAFGLTIAEAMASALPVVATRAGGIPELIVDGDSGLLFDPGNVDQLAAALRRVMQSETLRAELGRNAALRAARLFGLEECVRRHVDVLEDAAGVRRGGL